MTSSAAKKDHRELLVSAFLWSSNVGTSVVIIFVIKALLSIYKFHFATTVSGMHFVVCAWAVWGMERLGWADTADMPLRAVLIYAVIGALSIGFANMSLLLNSVGFYQIAKLLMSPFVATVEMVWLKKRFPPSVLCCMGVVLLGVAIVTVSDVTVHPTGVIIAALFIVTAGMQQIMCGHLQATLKIQSHQLMSNTSFLQGMLLLIAGPFCDKLASGKWLMEWEATVPGVQMLILSCVLSIAVNMSQFMVLGRFSATSFQVLGHAKTLMVLLGGWLLFDEPVNGRKLAGMTLAFSGMVAYGMFSMRHANQAREKARAEAAALAAAELPLVPVAAALGAGAGSDEAKGGKGEKGVDGAGAQQGLDDLLRRDEGDAGGRDEVVTGGLPDLSTRRGRGKDEEEGLLGRGERSAAGAEGGKGRAGRSWWQELFGGKEQHARD